MNKIRCFEKEIFATIQNSIYNRRTEIKMKVLRKMNKSRIKTKNLYDNLYR